MAAVALSDHQTDFATQAIGPRLSETVHKVDRAVARLEELQSLVRTSHTTNASAKVNNSMRREKLALHAKGTPKTLPYRHITGNRTPHASHRQPITSGNLRQHPQQSQAYKIKPALPIAASRRSARVAALPPPSPHRKVCSSSHTAAALKVPGAKLPSPPFDMSQASPPSSACSSSVPAVTRRAPPKKEAAPSKLPRTFVVDAGPANPNRPWRLSASPSPASTSSTTSNYIYTPSSNSSALCSKSPSRFSPLYRQSSRSRKDHEIYQSQPLLCKSPEGFGTMNPKESSPNLPRKVPWFSQTRLSLPTIKVTVSNTKRAPRRFSLASETHRDSPPRPLPALITRLPMRRKSASSPNEKVAASGRRRSFSASTQKRQTVVTPLPEAPKDRQHNPTAPSDFPPLPLPPALQGQVVGLPPTSTSDHKGKVMHKRSSSCTHRCLLPLMEGRCSPNTLTPVACSLQHFTKKRIKGACVHGSSKENCFPGCSPAAWPCMRRSWSFSQQPSLVENLTGAGPYIVKQVKGYMQHGKNMNSHVYKVLSSGLIGSIKNGPMEVKTCLRFVLLLSEGDEDCGSAQLHWKINAALSQRLSVCYLVRMNGLM
ncbi:hypothetical protein GOP47_0028107 [Adiantum capillus-veneris]|nr:hypothetical protein GOP47_0028107 [Adiantum capillus-veneris]